MAIKIQVKKGTAAQWAPANTILLAGDQGFETNTKRMKIGDGTTPWNSLNYVDEFYATINPSLLIGA